METNMFDVITTDPASLAARLALRRAERQADTLGKAVTDGANTDDPVVDAALHEALAALSLLNEARGGLQKAFPGDALRKLDLTLGGIAESLRTLALALNRIAETDHRVAAQAKFAATRTVSKEEVH
jgi:hypothetical protein